MSPLALSVRFLQTQPDRKLLELARAGHERAFEALVQRYRRPLLNYCRRLSRSEASAEDALQQALLQAWIALGSGDGEIRDVRAWLYRIVHNVAISTLRRPVHDQVREDQAMEGGAADQVVERRLALRDALAGLASLPELQRQVMLSTALEGQSHDEVATALGLSHGAVRGLIYRARATLRAAAAAVVPGPLINWAARQDVGAGGRSAALAEAIGGGSAGVAGVLLKGGAIVATAGALAGAAGVALHPNSHRFRGHRPSPAQTAAGAAAAGTSLVRSASGAPSTQTAVSAALGTAGSSAALRVAGSASQGSVGAQAWHGRAVTPSGQHRSPFTVSSSGSGSSTSKSNSSSHGPGGSSTGSGSSPSGAHGSSGSGSSGSSGSEHGSGGHDGSSIATSGSGGTSGKDGSGSGGGGDSSATAASSSETVSSDSSSSDGGSSGGGDGSSGGSSGPSGSGRSGSDSSHGGGSDGANATTTPSVPVPSGD
jgi:RNA polymerase sigma factor (sigma-70 family)